MVTKPQVIDEATQTKLNRLVEEHRAQREALLKIYPDPSIALDNFVRQHFDPQILLEYLEEYESGEVNDDELNGW